ncbi:MAG TPA: hypothetical protein VGE52_03490, partial [Pirellulales bacterium]
MKRLVLAGAAAALLCSAAFEIRAQETAPPTATAPRSGLGDRITNLRARLWGDKNGAPPSGAATATPPGAPAASEEAAPGALAPPAGSPYAGTAPATGGGIERLPADGSAPPLPASARANPNGQGYTGQGGVPPRMAAVPEPGSSRRRPDSDPAVSPELKALDDQPRQPFTPPTSGVRPGYQAPAFSTAPPSGSPASSAPAAVSADRESSNANAPGEASVSSDAGPATPPAPFRSHPGLTPLPPTGMTPPAASPFAQPAPSTASPPAATTAPLAASSNSAAPPNSAAT